MEVFTAEQTLYGSYGGTAGKPETVQLSYGFYVIGVCKKSPVVVHTVATSPTLHFVLNQSMVLSTYSRALGHGKAVGIGSMRPDPDDPDKYQVNIVFEAFSLFLPNFIDKHYTLLLVEV